jgi:hypothetical protein
MAAKRRLRSDHVICKHCRRDFGAITVLHLRNIHGYDGDHPINDYKQEFRLQSATCGEARKKISEAKETFWARRGQHWTRGTLIAEIQRLHRAGRLPCKRVPVRVYMAGRRLFGSWQDSKYPTDSQGKMGSGKQAAQIAAHPVHEGPVPSVAELAEMILARPQLSEESRCAIADLLRRDASVPSDPPQ